MSGDGLSVDDLFASARSDRPSPDVTDDVWRKVSAAAIPAGAATLAGAAGAKTASFGSYAAGAGLVFGAAGAALLMHVAGAFDGPPPRHAPRPAPARAVLAKGSGTTTLDDSTPRGRVDSPPPPPEALPAPRATTAKAVPTIDGSSSLAREARLVTDARQALLRDDAARALELMREARSLPTRMLEPEELRIEARALRALGRTDEALALELELRRRSAP